MSREEENAALRKVLAETIAAKEALDAEVERCHATIMQLRAVIRDTKTGIRRVYVSLDTVSAIADQEFRRMTQSEYLIARAICRACFGTGIVPGGGVCTNPRCSTSLESSLEFGL